MFLFIFIMNLSLDVVSLMAVVAGKNQNGDE